MIKPVELRREFRISFDGVATNTLDVWRTLVAARTGDSGTLRTLVTAQPILACCKYNYAPPLHFAVREGHVDVVGYLIGNGGFFRQYRSDFFLDSFVAMARERGHETIASMLEAVERDPTLAAPCVAPTDDMRIEIPDHEKRERFLELISAGSLRDVESAIEADPSLTTDPYQCWGEGVLAVPCNAGDRERVELLLRAGARVPEVTKWCARYYFKHLHIASILMEHGMNANHMNWHHVTLLHEVAFAGDIAKATLLLDHGAAIDAVDEEYRTTPLGLAVRGKQDAMVRFLLDRGADAGVLS